MNLHLLRIFFTVAEQHSFSRAAESLCLSQPAVSKSVRELEHQLNLPLIERTAGGMTRAKGARLTESGQAIFEHARGIFSLERAAIEDVRARIGLKRGRLIVGASTTIAAYWLPAYIAQFTQRFPSIEIEVRVGNTAYISETLIDCNIDVALVESAIDDPRIVATHWHDDELRIIAHPNSTLARKRKLSAAHLDEEIWLVRESGSGTREVSERMMQIHNIQPKRQIEFGSNEGIARAVASGLGIAMISTRVVHELLLLNQVKTVRYPHAHVLLRPLFFLRLRARPLSPLARAFHEILELPNSNPTPSKNGFQPTSK